MSDFKVGDWVVVKDSKTVFKVADVFKDGYNWYAPSIKLEPRSMWDSCIYGIPEPQSHLELWHPKEGEWCWFDKNKLGKFWKKQGTRNYWTLSDFVSISEKTKIPSGDYFVSDYCEPFIGQLPSFIKDNNEL